MIKNIKINKAVVATTMAFALASCIIPAQARSIGEFSNFKVTYSGGERFTSYETKWKDEGNGVVNLKDDSGVAWITANMKNSDGVYRGGCTLQRGTRKVFETTGKAGYKYKLGLKKTNNTGGGSVVINGSWSPDEA